MLGALLLNEPVAGKPKRFMKKRFIQCDEATIDIECKPERKIVKHVIKVIRSLDLDRSDTASVQEFIPQVTQFSSKRTFTECDLKAWQGLLEILRKNISDIEEEEFLLLLMEI